MTQHSRASKTPFILSQTFQRQLNMYALAASAAGVSLLALSPPSEAKVVYTKVHQAIGWNGVYKLDLNHDGTTDFLIQEWGRSDPYGTAPSNALLAKEAFGNAVQGRVSQYWFAAALKKGAWIGPHQGFISGGYNGELMADFHHSDGGSHTLGRWINVANRYLGLKFMVGGKTHYGWARLSVRQQGIHIAAMLTGYAYETVPGKGIRAGQTTGNADDSAPSGGWQDSEASGPRPSVANPTSNTLPPTSLGTLALGAGGVPQGRRP